MTFCVIGIWVNLGVYWDHAVKCDERVKKLPCRVKLLLKGNLRNNCGMLGKKLKKKNTEKYATLESLAY